MLSTKKTLLAAAFAVGFAGAAHAQTNLTLYGVVDGGLGYTQFKNSASGAKATKFGLESGVQSGNRWGLRGTEDLGGGLKALFQLESGFTLHDGQYAQGANRLLGREASLALANDAWGTLKFGRHTNFASLYAADLAAPVSDAFAEGHIGASFTSTATVRLDNLVTYETPVFSGFQFGVGYSFNHDGAQTFDPKGGTDTNVKVTTLGLRYSNGPLAVAAAYDRTDSDVAVSDDIQSWVIAGTYNFDVVKLHLGFGQDKHGIFSGRSPIGVGGFDNIAFVYDPDYKTNNYSVGLTVPLTDSSFMIGWQTARLSGSAKDNLGADKRSQNLFTAGYTYNLSRRTNVYAVGTYGTGYAFNDIKVTQGIVGLRHLF